MENNTFKFAGMNEAEINAAIKQEVLNAPVGSTCKFASESGTSYIRMRVYEEGFARKILPVQNITNNDLLPMVAGENLGVLVEIEPTQSLATSVPFDVAMPTEYYWGDRAVVTLFDIKTNRLQHNIKRLATYKMDLRKIKMDNALKAITKQEDWELIHLADQATSASGLTFAFAGGISRNTVTEMSKIMGKNLLNPGLVLTNDATFRDFMKLGQNAWGGPGAEKMLREGPKALGEPVMGGMKWLSTLKADIVNDNVAYIFTEPDYLGRFFEYQAPTLYVKREEDRITMNANETIGMAIINTNGVAKVTLFSGVSTMSNTAYPLPRPVQKISKS